MCTEYKKRKKSIVQNTQLHAARMYLECWTVVCKNRSVLVYLLEPIVFALNDSLPMHYQFYSYHNVTFCMWLCSAPLPVTNIKVVSFDQHQITFTWTSPPDSENLEYFLKLTSMFWRHSYSKTVRNKNVHTFSGLKSGTTYQLDLRTTVGQRSSDPVSYSQSTGETH